MSGDVWELFPFPTLSDGLFTDGSLLPRHEACRTCATHECARNEKAKVAVPEICRYGITYARIDESRLLAGVLATDGVSLNSRARNRLRSEPDRRVSSAKIVRAIEQARGLGAGVTDDFDVLKAEVLGRLEHEPEMHKALAAQLRQNFERNVQQSHDFLQLAKLVQGHAEALLAEKYPGVPAHEAAEQAPVEGAIYFTTQLMVLKLDSLVFLQDPQRANERPKNFKIHPLVLKYARIYQWQASQKELSVRLEGECYASANYNAQAIGAVVQGILDNLVKYAPGGSDALIRFDQRGTDVTISFSSLGPRIEPHERKNIFLPGFRAAAAQSVESTGQGIGLATAQQVSDVVGLDLAVSQEDEEAHRFPGNYGTTFTVRLHASE